MVVFCFGGGAGGIEMISVAWSASESSVMAPHPLVPSGLERSDRFTTTSCQGVPKGDMIPHQRGP